MNIAWATDPHLNHASRQTRLEFFRSLARLDEAVLLVSGDLATSLEIEAVLEEIAHFFKGSVYFVLGNHDFYGGSILDTRGRVTKVAARTKNLFYLGGMAPVRLSAETALIGTDGWGDARYGNWSGTKVVINDFRLIDDLAWSCARPLLMEKLRALGDDCAYQLRPRLHKALAKYEQVIVLTHVPPFVEAAWHDGAPSDNDHAPFFACKAVGDVLLAAAEEYPAKQILVLCGHTHSGGLVDIRPNLRVITGPAVYERPAMQPRVSVP